MNFLKRIDPVVGFWFAIMALCVYMLIFVALPNERVAEAQLQQKLKTSTRFTVVGEDVIPRMDDEDGLITILVVQDKENGACYGTLLHNEHRPAGLTQMPCSKEVSHVAR